MNYVALVIIAIILGFCIYRFIRFKSLAGALYGSVATPVGHADAADSFHMPVQIRVHSLDSSTPYKVVGLELVAKWVGRYRVMPVTLSRAQAAQLGELLLTAAGEPPNNSFKPKPLRGSA